MERLITHYAYPVTHEIVLGKPEKFTLNIEPDLPIKINHILCNTLALGMFIISENNLFYKHDPAGLKELPFKKRNVQIFKNCFESITIEYFGYIPANLLGGMKFMFTYHFIGETALD